MRHVHVVFSQVHAKFRIFEWEHSYIHRFYILFVPWITFTIPHVHTRHSRCPKFGYAHMAVDLPGRNGKNTATLTMCVRLSH